jgi:tRNA (guanine-N7-)-methyltransferase
LRPSGITEHRSHISRRRDALRETLLAFLTPDSSFVWEVGCGHGHFLAAYAAAHPQQACVGIDIASDRIDRAEKKRSRAHLANLHFVRADAEDFLAAMPAGARFSAIFLLFPDPWPKRRHHKHRVMTAGFLSAAAAAAAPGTGLFFRTDHDPYYLEAAAAVRSHGDWREADPATWPFEEPTVFQRRAERHFSLVALRR